MNSVHPDDRYVEQTRVRWRWAFRIAVVIAISFLIQTWIGAEVALHPTLLPGFDVPRMGSHVSADDDCCVLSNRRASR